MGTIERAMKRARGNTEAPDVFPPADSAAIDTPAPPGESPGTAQLRERAPDIRLDFGALKKQGLMTLDDEQRWLHEQYRMIKRLLIAHAFSGKTIGPNPANLIQITSSVAGEGKTFTAFNLAMSIAMEHDFTALLVDADLTERRLTRLTGLTGQPGLTDVLENSNMDLSQVIYRPNVERLAVLPAGSAHVRATELIASNTMHRITEELATRYPDRVILFDSTPLCLDSQAATLAGHMGQVVIVVEAGRTPEKIVRESTGMIDQSAARVGLLLNKSSRSYYGYGNYGGY